MKKIITTLRNIFSIEELKSRIITTLILLVVYRIGTFIVLPGIDPVALAAANEGGATEGILGLIDTFAGGAFGRASILALGIMPYISASIVVQLLTMAVPAFQKMQKEGEDGRRRINQITRYLTIGITGVQAWAFVANFRSSPEKLATIMISDGTFLLSSVILLIAGTMFAMWLGERITDRGLGNGISLIIMVGIISQLPFSLAAEFATKLSGQSGGMIFLIVEMIIWLAVILSVVLLVQGTRKIPVQYAKRIVGNKQYGGVRQYLPLKVNAAGVMPIIFAQALMFIPGSMTQVDGIGGFFSGFVDFTSWTYNITFFLLIVLFTYFYTAITINPSNIANDLKKNGGFIPGVKPGRSTANFIDKIMSRITLPGAIYLGLVAVFPPVAIKLGVNNQFAQFYGGTSLLIMVGVVLDTLQQIESHLLMRQYDGLMKSGKIKGRTGGGISLAS
jgi:preprotein translocase subunit SecY